MSEFRYCNSSIRETAEHFAESLSIYGQRATPHAPAIGEALLCFCCAPCNPFGAALLNWLWKGNFDSYAWFLLFPLEAPHRSANKK